MSATRENQIVARTVRRILGRIELRRSAYSRYESLESHTKTLAEVQDLIRQEYAEYLKDEEGR